MEEDGVKNIWAKTPSHATYFLNIFFIVISFCFDFGSLIVAVTTTGRGGIIKNGGNGVENVWAKTPSHATYFLKKNFYCPTLLLLFFVPVPVPGYSLE